MQTFGKIFNTKKLGSFIPVNILTHNLHANYFSLTFISNVSLTLQLKRNTQKVQGLIERFVQKDAQNAITIAKV